MKKSVQGYPGPSTGLITQKDLQCLLDEMYSICPTTSCLKDSGGGEQFTDSSQKGSVLGCQAEVDWRKRVVYTKHSKDLKSDLKLKVSRV